MEPQLAMLGHAKDLVRVEVRWLDSSRASDDFVTRLRPPPVLQLPYSAAVGRSVTVSVASVRLIPGDRDAWWTVL